MKVDLIHVRDNTAIRRVGEEVTGQGGNQGSKVGNRSLFVPKKGK